MEERLYTIQIDVTVRTRQRLEMAKALISFTNPSLERPSWGDAVTMLAEVVPIGELLKNAIDGTATTIKESENE